MGGSPSFVHRQIERVAIEAGRQRVRGIVSSL
jgi:hypothetical protein